MINIPPIKLSTSIKTELLPDVSKTWKVNQVLNATTESGGEALSKVVLRVGRHLFEAHTPVPLKTGDQLKLLVKSLGDTPLLNIQTQTTRPAIATDKIRLFIAQQQSLSTFIEITQKLTTENKIPAEIKPLLTQLISTIPSKEELLQPAKLKQIIQNSGVFLEPKLASQNTTHIHQDIKAQLLNISHTLQSMMAVQTTKDIPTTSKDIQNIISQFVKGNIPIKQLGEQLAFLFNKELLITLESHLKTLQSQPVTLSKTDSLYNLNQLFTYLHKHIQGKQLVESLLNIIKNSAAINELKLAVDNTLSSITSQQLTPLTKEADNFLLLLFGILIKDKDQFNLINFKIEQDQSNDKNDNENWTATLNFEFISLGNVQAKIHLLNTQISTVFTAENPLTVKLIKNNLELLHTAFQSIGFNNINIDVTQNKINAPLAKPENIQIVDEEA